jgi:arylsulfatase
MTYAGGVRTPLIAHWPAGIPSPGAKDEGFHYVTDIAPTILEAVGVAVPASHRGVPQMPVHGHSFLPSLRAAVTSPHDDRHPPQHFEIFGHRGIWHGGWKALTNHVLGSDFDTENWELYDLKTDPSETVDLADDKRELLDLMVRLWWSEATRNGVLPLDDRRGALANVRSPHSPRRRLSHVFYPRAVSLPSSCAPDLVNRSFTITADVDSAGEGVLIAQGGRFGGYALFVLDGHAIFDYNNGVRHQILRSDRRVPDGSTSVAVEFQKTGEYRGVASLTIDGARSGELEIADTMRTMTLMEEGLECGRDELTPVSKLYQAPFSFQGQLRRVRVQMAADGGASAEDEFTEAMKRQ